MILPILTAIAGFTLGSMIGVAFGKSVERQRSDDSLLAMQRAHERERARDAADKQRAQPHQLASSA